MPLPVSPRLACSPTYIKLLWQTDTSSHFWYPPNLCDRTLYENGPWHIYTIVGCEWDSHHHKPLTKKPQKTLDSHVTGAHLCVCVWESRGWYTRPRAGDKRRSSKFGVGGTLIMRVSGHYRAETGEITTLWLYGSLCSIHCITATESL